MGCDAEVWQLQVTGAIYILTYGLSNRSGGASFTRGTTGLLQPVGSIAVFSVGPALVRVR